MATLTDKGIKDGSLIGNPNVGDYFRFMDSNNSDLLTLRDSAGVDTVYGTGGGVDLLGWVAVGDTTYTSGSPFSLSSGVDTVLDWKLDTVNDTYAPNGYSVTDFFDDANDRITSPELGACYMFRLTFKCTPSANSRQLVTAYSIGTGVGSQIVIDQRSSELRVSGSPSYISMSSVVYSLGTFLTNGMEIILNANTNCSIYDINMVISKIN